MKTVSALVVSLGLAFAAAPALAGDIAQIGQFGGANNAVIEQVVSNGNNFATVRQGDSAREATANNAQLVQQGVDNSSIDVFQWGFNNNYNVYQHDGADLHANINTHSAAHGNGFSESNSATIEQTGYGARAWVEQGGMLNRAEIVQQSWGGANSAEILQAGMANQGAIFQSGSNLSASIMQSSGAFDPGFGSVNTATIRQGY